MYQLTFTLQQHTPIIHFQHTQEGATLRATELKPKLDKFIIKHCITEKIDYREWLIGKGGHPALDYKLRITKSNNEDYGQRFIFEEYYDKSTNAKKFKVNRKTSYPMILANMVAKNTKDELKDIRFFKDLNCSIFCFHSGLKTILENNLSAFFALNNFGNRNNKGYGGFTVTKIGVCDKKWDEKLLPIGTPYLQINDTDTRKIFDILDFFYKWLKSGINYTFNSYKKKCIKGRYNKAVLFEYLESCYPKRPLIGENWEKRWIKEKFLSLAPKSPPDYNPRFFRALLGYSDNHTFTKATCNFDTENVSNNQIKLKNKLELENNHVPREIERIKSPLIFKVIKVNNNMTKVYLLIDKEHIDEIYSKGHSTSFIFFDNRKLSLAYRIGTTEYSINFEYPKHNLADLDIHLYRIAPFNTTPPLKQVYEDIIYFKNGFQTIELPSSIIDYNALLKFFKTKYPKFMAKDFKWRDIINSEIEIKTI